MRNAIFGFCFLATPLLAQSTIEDQIHTGLDALSTDDQLIACNELGELSNLYFSNLPVINLESSYEILARLEDAFNIVDCQSVIQEKHNNLETLASKEKLFRSMPHVASMEPESFHHVENYLKTNAADTSPLMKKVIGGVGKALGRAAGNVGNAVNDAANVGKNVGLGGPKDFGKNVRGDVRAYLVAKAVETAVQGAGDAARALDRAAGNAGRVWGNFHQERAATPQYAGMYAPQVQGMGLEIGEIGNPKLKRTATPAMTNPGLTSDTAFDY